jgi:hypothetical protein
MRWTTRLKRYGSLVAITELRAVQFQRLAVMFEAGDEIQKQIARDHYIYLEENPVRVLSSTTERALGWQEPEQETSDAAQV